MSDHYKELLIKYMQNVVGYVGTTLLWPSRSTLTEAERDELRILYRQAQLINEVVHSISISSEGE